MGALAASANAGFTGFTVENSVNGSGNNVSKVYANFDALPAVLLNVFGVQNTGGSATFIHNDFAGGSWAPQFTIAPGDNDSYVTIGGTFGFANSTTADPGWGGAGFNQPGIPNGAGWFNNNPPNLQGAANAQGKVLVGQFVISGDATRSYFAKIGFNAGIGTPTVFGEGNFTVGVPAPGAFALLGLAGLAGRRRRA
ncbi:MAG: hypothetical protein JNM94_09445 [Phycisphaerae bacterium]|nr:hypothetical protein [Phycisphaerae bacterium]